MFGRKKKTVEAEPAPPQPLTEAMRAARIEAAERSGVVVDLRDADLARLELLNDALAPVFAQVPDDVDLFDTGLSRGDTPRLWVDMIAHVEMGRDKRLYRFVQDTRYGRATLAESYDVQDVVRAVTNYVARRLIERERALAGDAAHGEIVSRRIAASERRKRKWSAIRGFVLGVIVAVVALFLIALTYAQP
jgi:hypothetical protein